MDKKRLIIGVSGNHGSFSEEAANYYITEEGLTNCTLEYLTSVENVLAALEDEKIHKGVFPIENSNGGIVIEAVYAMAKHLFSIEKIFEIDIRMNLLARPGMKVPEIKKIISHQQALKQCRMYLKRKWPEVELSEYSDTASAAKDLSEGVFDPGTAVIAPKVCAEIYGLELLEEGIQDLKFNFTSFIVAGKS
jgi:prephenate dehydratase